MDLVETESAYRLAVELPGVRKEAIEVGIYENTVTIGAEAQDETGAQQNGSDINWLLRERQFGRFSRSIALPEAVDETASEARYTDGVLYLTLQKKRTSRTKRLTVN
jgi:HSP20 family protein